MPNTFVPAAAIGLPAISRRSALLSAALATIPAGAVATIRENDEIMAAGLRLGPVLAAYQAAHARKIAACSAYERVAPPVPHDVIATRNEVNFGFARQERDCEDRVIFNRGNPRVRYILRKEDLEAAIAGHGEGSPISALAESLLPAVAAFEDQVQQARDAVALDAAIDADFFAARKVEELALAIAKMPARTALGIRMKAQALSACGAIGSEALARVCWQLGPALADAVLAILPADAA